uniref:Uncharacterized protein n=1 Tax=Arundo donax TaxID=35708 RepID=A0A0A9BLG2_ARUDO
MSVRHVTNTFPVTLLTKHTIAIQTFISWQESTILAVMS